MTKKITPLPKELSFESTIESLDSLVETLENQETSLECSMQAFEAGIKLTQQAQGVLSAAEQRIQLLKDNNGPVDEGFDDGEGNG